MRSHRNRGCLAGVLMLGLTFVGFLALVVGVLVAGDQLGRVGGVLAACVVLVIVSGGRPYYQATRRRRRILSAERTTVWALANGWTRSDRTTWPGNAGNVTVGTVLISSMAGMQITVGEVTWSKDALGGAVDTPDGSGVFTRVRLPRSYPSTAVQRRREFGRDHRHEDRFDVVFRVVLDDTYFGDQLRKETLRRAHLRGDIPPWSIVGDELMLVEYGNLTPGNVHTLQQQAAEIIELLEIRVSLT